MDEEKIIMKMPEDIEKELDQAIGNSPIEEKYNPEEEINKLCEQYKITIINDNSEENKDIWNRIKQAGRMNVFHNELLKFIESEEDANFLSVDDVGVKVMRLSGEKSDTISLKELHDVYKKLLYIEDSKRIDVGLAIDLSKKTRSVPLWMIFVGPSGDLKSEQLSALDDGNSVHYLSRITSKTLINGYKNKEKFPDLAPQLDNKHIIIKDMAPLLKLNPVEKGEVWAQLRELYDGNIGAASGMGMDVRYKDLFITFSAGSTPAIDGQILIHQDLGTRELIYRTTGSEQKKKLMEKCMENEGYLEKIRKKLKKVTTNFIKNTEIKEKHVPKEIKDELMEIATYIAYMRATAEIDQFTQEVRTDVSIEEPTRLIMQLKRLFVCLMSLKEDYSEKRALDILWHIAKSSAFQTRKNVLTFLVNNGGEFSTSRVAKELFMGKSTIKRDLGILWNMKLVERRDEETSFPDKFNYYWQISKLNPFIEKYSKYEKKRQKLKDFEIVKI